MWGLKKTAIKCYIDDTWLWRDKLECFPELLRNAGNVGFHPAHSGTYESGCVLKSNHSGLHSLIPFDPHILLLCDFKICLPKYCDVVANMLAATQLIARKMEDSWPSKFGRMDFKNVTCILV